MKRLGRRSLLSLAATGGVLAVAGCVTNGKVNPKLVQVVNDVSMALNALGNIIPALPSKAPRLVSQSLADKMSKAIQQAKDTLAKVQNNLNDPNLATNLQQVEANLNSVLNILVGIPGIPEPYATIIMAASVIAPELEAFVNSLVNSNNNAAVHAQMTMAAHSGQTMTMMKARAVLAAAAH